LLCCVTDFMFVFILLFVLCLCCLCLCLCCYIFVCVYVSDCVVPFACFSVHHCNQITKKIIGMASHPFASHILLLNKFLVSKKRFSWCWFWLLTFAWYLVMFIFSSKFPGFWAIGHFGILVVICRASGVSKISVGTSLDRHLLCAEPLEC